MKTSIIGALFIASLALVLYLGITLSGAGSLGEFFGEEPQSVRVVFDQVTGLKVRDEVSVSGLTVGRVHDLELLDDGRVAVTCRVGKGAKLFKDASAEIISVGALGGRTVAIAPGNPSSGAFDTNSTIEGVYVPDFLVSAGRLTDDIRKLVSETTEVVQEIGVAVDNINQEKGALGAIISNTNMRDDMSNLLSNLNESSTSIRSASDNLDSMIKTVVNERGLIHEAIYNEATGRNLTRAIADGQETMANLNEASTDVREVVAKINEGNGVIPTLINDEQLAADTRRLVSSAATAADDVSATFVEAREVMSGINKGKGTVGKLFTDDALYNDILRTVNTLQASFEDLREQAPVTTFASVIFQVFQ